MKNNFEELYKEVHQLFSNHHEAAHDEKHALRVAGLAKKIALGENHNPTVAEATGLLHDLGRTVKK